MPFGKESIGGDSEDDASGDCDNPFAERLGVSCTGSEDLTDNWDSEGGGCKDEVRSGYRSFTDWRKSCTRRILGRAGRAILLGGGAVVGAVDCWEWLGPS